MGEQGPLATVSDALSVIARHAGALPSVRLPLAEAGGLTLAEPVVTDTDYPPFDRAIRDGFAVRSSDCAGGRTTLRIVGELLAGQVAEQALSPGEAVVINTGAPMPPGADAVVKVEHTERSADGEWMTTDQAPGPGQYVDARAGQVRAGEVVLEAGVRLGPAQVAAAAAAGAAEVVVHRRCRLAIVVTGDELIPVAERPVGGQIRNCNGLCLVGLAREAGCEVIDLGVAGDTKTLLAAKVAEALTADVACISGGVSMGDRDYVPAVLADAGVRFKVQKVAIKPGRPMVFGIGPAGQVVFGLPGNPVSCFVCFLMFVQAALAAMQGRAVSLPPDVRAVLTEPLPAAGERKEYVPGRLVRDEAGGWQAAPTPWQGSGDPFGLARANGLLVRERHAPAARVGCCLPVIPLDW